MIGLQSLPFLHAAFTVSVSVFSQLMSLRMLVLTVYRRADGDTTP